jgi:hypothetical protein
MTAAYDPSAWRRASAGTPVLGGSPGRVGVGANHPSHGDALKAVGREE